MVKAKSFIFHVNKEGILSRFPLFFMLPTEDRRNGGIVGCEIDRKQKKHLSETDAKGDAQLVEVFL